ncbi:MAG: hypothetical protein COB30_017170 [Ectothiorhodospiraceae bacterium]|nr:hypothetical protein [Ectothiorhodospiraceae bacterium]
MKLTQSPNLLLTCSLHWTSKKGTVKRLLPLLLLVLMSACKTIESTEPRDYSNGISEMVAASDTQPAYAITETMGAAGSGYAYLIEKVGGRWRVMYDSFDAKAFAKPVAMPISMPVSGLQGATVKEVPADVEVLWTDGYNVVAYFGTQPLMFSRVDGSFACPKNSQDPGHRACRSQLTETKSVFGGLSSNSNSRPFMLDMDEIKQAITDTGIVTIAKKRIAREKQ